MSNVRIPIVLPPLFGGIYGNVSDTGVYVDFSAFGVMGSVSMVNNGAKDVCAQFFQTLPVGPFPTVFGIAPNVFRLPTGGKILNLDDISYAVIALITLAGAPATDVQVIGLQRSGIGSGGFV